ncbi:MAG: flagellar basal-body MS-ring/collar protein FliF [Vicinamibacterales bacterium]
MNPEQLLTRVKTGLGGLTTLQITTLLGVFALVVGLVIGSAYYVNRPAFTLLFSDLEPEAAQQVVERLQADKVEYELANGGRSIRVPLAQVDELRLRFASGGLPSSGRIGFEIFDRTQFGQTEFLEQVNYRRALEGEIARTIATIQEVANARVHIALGKDSLFTERAEPAKASVVLKLKTAKPPSAAVISGIANLVAASVEGLRPESVVIVDTNGRPLLRPTADEDEPLGGAQLERQQRLEKDLSQRVSALLEPVVGVDHVKVNVALQLRSDSQEQTQELWDPTNPVVRSRQTTSDIGASASVAGGIAGARGNMPQQAKDSPLPGQPPVVPPEPIAVAQGGGNALVVPGAATRSAETTNYEISKTVTHTVRPRGDIARMTVAVILDDQQVRETGQDGTVQVVSKPRDPKELTKIQALVASAVGLDEQRGDRLTVENVAFSVPFVEDVPPTPFVQRIAPTMMEGGRVLSIIAIVLVVLFGVVKPLVARVFGGGPAGALAVAGGGETPLPTVTVTPKTVEELEHELEQQMINAANEAVSDKRRVPVLTKRLSAETQKDPQGAARLVRSWLLEDRR